VVHILHLGRCDKQGIEFTMNELYVVLPLPSQRLFKLLVQFCYGVMFIIGASGSYSKWVFKEKNP